MKVARVVELSPGDGLFIPRDWFHHVEALEPFNVLVNYWWDGSERGRKPGEMCDPPSRRTQ
jgi:oxalate decarboxylase/phosphoglucose isomerase-like protein (cupin superfamily)